MQGLLTHIMNYLRFWVFKAKRVRAEGNDDTKARIKSYMDKQSDLLVMGANSRSRLRQRIFGGATEYILHQAYSRFDAA